MNTENQLIIQIKKSFTALLIIAGLCLVLLPETKYALNFKSSVSMDENNKADKVFDEKFREGRDLIDKEEWAKAAEKFNEIISKYPDNKSTDAALYWLAFCYKKQKRFTETDATLDRLLKDFPSSSWADDGRVMKLEISASLGKLYNSNVFIPNSALPPGTYSTNSGNSALAELTAKTTPQTFETAKLLGEINAAVSRTPLDREDEIRLAAFQSLFSADQKKGIEVMSKVLNSDSEASENLKLEILRAVRRPRTASDYTYSISGTTPSVQTVNSSKNQTTDLLKESLIKSFQNETNIKIRKEIIYTLANLKDEQTADYLARLYSSEDNREVKKAIINGFGSSRGTSGFYIAGINPAQNSNLVTANTNQAPNNEFAKLLEIAKIEKDNELRQLALSNLQRFAGWEKNGQVVETLIEIYDSESNEEFKKSIIQNLGKMKQRQADEKLMNIAKNDKSDKLKLEAIYALRNSNSPEALKYLEELIK